MITNNYLKIILYILLVTEMLSGKTLITNGTFYGHPNVHSVGCNDGIIQSFNPDPKQKYDIIIDLDGGWVYPGFIDGHMHLTGLGWSLEILDFVGTKNKQSILDIVIQAVSQTPSGHWVQGRGWDQNDWPIQEFPTAHDLDIVSNRHPIVLKRTDGHVLWANSIAMNLAGISNDTPSPEGGKILRDQSGVATGIFIDNAMNLITSIIPKTTEGDTYRQTLKAQSLLNSLGITSVHDAGSSTNDISSFQKLIDEKKLSVRVFSMLNHDPNVYSPYLKEGPVVNPFLTVRTLKVFMDGALGSRGASLLEPYSDRPSESGLLFMGKNELGQIVQLFNSLGFQVNTHGIGDRAIRTILDAYESFGDLTLRNRIEHAQIVHPEDISRFKSLNVIPAMQPVHCTSDMPWIQDRLGANRLSRAYPWHSFAQLNIPIPGGSDAPVEYPDPLTGIYAAITRQDENGNPKGGWQSQERLSLEQAINMYTIWPAFAAFEENKKGRIELGYYADFTVLDRELTSEKPLSILKTNVTHTIVDGRIVYQSYAE